ncbi:MAG: pyrroloquinoline-quinone synthase PqqC [bacterium]|nr:pyrroloquinoline-quinone synthase PqqC [bacterium]
MTAGAPVQTRAEFEARLRGMERFYHIHHPFQLAMNEGGLDKEAVRGWVANRFYYQIQIPRKDAAILSNCPDRNVRRLWIRRILDHDGEAGDGDDSGGIEAWLRLGESVGLTREEILDQRHVLPGVRFAVDAYVRFAQTAPWQEAAASSLTELFAPTIHQKRLDNWPTLYPWIDEGGYDYFRRRLGEARRDVEHGLQLTLDGFDTRALQDRAVEVLQFKLDILWTMLDAMWMAYVEKRPPYAGCPEA